jgi:transcription initiation factor IIE alpha subunit
MDEFVECKHCGGELRFVQMDEEHTHTNGKQNALNAKLKKEQRCLTIG